MERSSRKTLVGKVVSIKNDKTIIVAVEIFKKHPLYDKRYKSTKRYQVHDETNQAQLEDVVKIVETRPYSKLKHFRLEKITTVYKGGQ
jgi:small subunit ribosomal protein S17